MSSNTTAQKMQVDGLQNLKNWLLDKAKFIGFLQNQKVENPLRCSLSLAAESNQNKQTNLFVVNIQGLIRAPKDCLHTIVQILITDVTDGVSKAQPAHSSLERWQMDDSSVFCYSTDLGRLPKAVTQLSDWTTVAKIDTDWLILPRTGKRDLILLVSLLARQNGEKIASTYCSFTYNSSALGYVDSYENTEQAKIQALTLAFAVAIADGDLADYEIELIKNWALSNITAFNKTKRSKRTLERMINKTVRLLKQGHQIDKVGVCEEIAKLAPLDLRWGILQLCMYVAKASGTVTENELIILNGIADLFEIDKDRFLAMTERFFPSDICQVKDIRLILGVTSDMNKDQTRKQLNRQYRKWSARVTNFDPQIRTRAASMLKYIAKARSEYVD